MKALRRQKEDEGDRSHFMMLSNGKVFYPFDPDPSVMDIEVIGPALAKLCRFSGQCEHFYSVAQHSVLCSKFVPEELALQALMHDATEAFLADIPKPLKLGLPQYEAVEQLVWESLAGRYGLPVELDALVKDVDIRACKTEGEDLNVGRGVYDWGTEYHPEIQRFPLTVYPVGPEVAEAMFMQRYEELTRGTREW